MEDKKYSKLKAAFEATQVQVPADFTERVMKRIEESDACAPYASSKRRRWWWVAAAACMLIILGIGMALWPVAQPFPSVVGEARPRGGVESVTPLEGRVVTALSDSQEEVPTSKLVDANTRQGAATPKRSSRKRRKELRTQQSLPDTLGNGIWQRRENVVTALRILSECEADIRQEEQEILNGIVEATFRATPQPKNVILVTNEAGDYEVIETKNIIEI